MYSGDPVEENRCTKNVFLALARNTHVRGQSLSDTIDVLLVEDNPGDVRLTREAFKTIDFDVTIHVVSDGDEALSYVSNSVTDESVPYPDLVLLDLDLPRVDGFTVLNEFKSDRIFRTIPILVLTSSDDEWDIVKSYELSTNAYLTKPTDPDEFNSLARAVEKFWMETAQFPGLRHDEESAAENI